MLRQLGKAEPRAALEWLRPARARQPARDAPRRLADAGARPAASAASCFIRSAPTSSSSRAARAASADYLRRVLGKRATLGNVFRHYYAFASTIQDRVYFLTGKYGFLDVTVRASTAQTQALLRQSRGCILLGSHLGSFEVLRRAAPRKALPPINILMYVDNAGKLNSVLRRSRRPPSRASSRSAARTRCCACTNASRAAKSSASSATGPGGTTATAAASSWAMRPVFRSARCCSPGAAGAGGPVLRALPGRPALRGPPGALRRCDPARAGATAERRCGPGSSATRAPGAPLPPRALQLVQLL